MRVSIRDLKTGLVLFDCELQIVPALLAVRGLDPAALALAFKPGRELELQAKGKTMTISELYTVPDPIEEA